MFEEITSIKTHRTKMTNFCFDLQSQISLKTIRLQQLQPIYLVFFPSKFIWKMVTFLYFMQKKQPEDTNLLKNVFKNKKPTGRHNDHLNTNIHHKKPSIYLVFFSWNSYRNESNCFIWWQKTTFTIVSLPSKQWDEKKTPLFSVFSFTYTLLG